MRHFLSRTAVWAITVALAAMSCGDGSTTTTGATGGSSTGSGGSPSGGAGSGGAGATTTGSGGTGATTATGSGGEGNTPLCPDENGNPIPKLKLTQVATGLSHPVLAI